MGLGTILKLAGGIWNADLSSPMPMDLGRQCSTRPMSGPALAVEHII